MIHHDRQYESKYLEAWDYSHVKFYIHLLQNQGKNISLKGCYDVKIGDIVLTYEDEIKDFLEEKYDFTIIDESFNLKMYEIIGEK